MSIHIPVSDFFEISQVLLSQGPGNSVYFILLSFPSIPTGRQSVSFFVFVLAGHILVLPTIVRRSLTRPHLQGLNNYHSQVRKCPAF